MSATMQPWLSPAICFGSVMHQRLAPVSHGFNYPIAFLRLPLSQIDRLSLPLLGIERRRLFSLYARDHGARDGSPLLPWIRQLLAHHQLQRVTDGEVVLQTLPRLMGYLFNPVSFWFCHDRDGQLRVVLAEVNNTFGEHHNYLIYHSTLAPIRNGQQLTAQKVFHVSPFFPVAGEYRFSFHLRDHHYGVAIDYYHDQQCQLQTYLGGEPRPYRNATVGCWFRHHPFATLGVIARIHWQALPLLLRRVPLFSKPPAPTEETTR